MTNNTKRYVIWSEEHGCWWGPGSHGYTRSLQAAGRYSKADAEAIVENANQCLAADDFHEVAFLDPQEWH